MRFNVDYETWLTTLYKSFSRCMESQASSGFFSQAHPKMFLLNWAPGRCKSAISHSWNHLDENRRMNLIESYLMRWKLSSAIELQTCFNHTLAHFTIKASDSFEYKFAPNIVFVATWPIQLFLTRPSWCSHLAPWSTEYKIWLTQIYLSKYFAICII